MTLGALCHGALCQHRLTRRLSTLKTVYKFLLTPLVLAVPGTSPPTRPNYEPRRYLSWRFVDHSPVIGSYVCESLEPRK